MIPYYIKLKEDKDKYCILCGNRVKKGQTVLLYGNINTPKRNGRYCHRWCIIKYSFKQRLK